MEGGGGGGNGSAALAATVEEESGDAVGDRAAPAPTGALNLHPNVAPEPVDAGALAEPVRVGAGKVPTPDQLLDGGVGRDTSARHGTDGGGRAGEAGVHSGRGVVEGEHASTGSRARRRSASPFWSFVTEETQSTGVIRFSCSLCSKQLVIGSNGSIKSVIERHITGTSPCSKSTEAVQKFDHLVEEENAKGKRKGVPLSAPSVKFQRLGDGSDALAAVELQSETAAEDVLKALADQQQKVLAGLENWQAQLEASQKKFADQQQMVLAGLENWQTQLEASQKKFQQDLVNHLEVQLQNIRQELINRFQLFSQQTLQGFETARQQDEVNQQVLYNQQLYNQQVQQTMLNNQQEIMAAQNVIQAAYNHNLLLFGFQNPGLMGVGNLDGQLAMQQGLMGGENLDGQQGLMGGGNFYGELAMQQGLIGGGNLDGQLGMQQGLVGGGNLDGQLAMQQGLIVGGNLGQLAMQQGLIGGGNLNGQLAMHPGPMGGGNLNMVNAIGNIGNELGAVQAGQNWAVGDPPIQGNWLQENDQFLVQNWYVGQIDESVGSWPGN